MSRKDPKAAPVPMIADRLEVWPIDRLVPYEGNAKTHPDDQVDRIARSIETFGFCSPILVAGEGIVAGHGRLLAARQLGMTELPVVLLDHLTEEQRTAYLLADNRLAELGEWDVAALERELASIPDVDLEAIGFSPSELEDLIAGVDDATPKRRRPPKRAPEAGPAPQKPTTELGDVWILGDHRFLCGDSTVEASVAIALDDQVADCAIVDAPYAIFGSSTGVGSSVADDRMVRPTFEGILRVLASSLKPFGHAYTFCDWRSWAAWYDSARNTGLVPKNLLVWVKPGTGIGSMWGNQYELVGFWARDVERTGVFAGHATGARMIHRGNVLVYGRAGGKGDVDSKTHNAQKPVDLLEELVDASTEKGDLILDTYAGSGSVLLACERKGRRSTSVEIEPKWVDVALARWSAMTGKKPRLGKKSGKTFAAVTKERRGR